MGQLVGATLRFKFGEIYTCAASASFAYQDPQARGASFRGDIMINFSCDPGAGHRLAALAMEDVRAMQRDGPSAEEVATAVEVETRALVGLALLTHSRHFAVNTYA